ncbi:MAG: response regulator [Calditrichia bacterium]|nr:response regulator [Calditrichia bacterium]
MTKNKIHSSLNILLDNIEGANLLLEYYADFSQKIFQCRDFKSVILALHHELRKIYAKQQIEFVLWQTDGKLLKFVYDSTTGKVKSPLEIDTENTLYQHTLEQQQTILTNNYQNFCENLGVDDSYVNASSWLGIPMTVRGKVLGMVVIWDNSIEHYFRLQDKQFMSIITLMTAFALENISLYDYIVEKSEPASELPAPSGLRLASSVLGGTREHLLEFLLQEDHTCFAGLFMRSQSHDRWRKMGCSSKNQSYQKLDDNLLQKLIYLQEDTFDQTDVLFWQSEKDNQKISATLSESLQELELNAVLLLPCRIQHFYYCVMVIAYDNGINQPEQEVMQSIQFIYNLLIQSIEKDLLMEHKKNYESYIQHLERMKLVGELASGSAHHLNNILSVITGRSQILAKKLNDSSYSKDIAMIEQAAEDGAQAVRRLQSVKAKSIPVRNFEHLNVNDLVLEVVEIARPRFEREAQSQGLTYDMKLTLGSVAYVKGDAAALREVFLNMINNALDSMPKGGKMTIQTTLEKGKVFIFFSDTGGGIPEDVKEKIFQPFFSTKGEKGNGLGLSIAAEIVSKHRGKIYVDSILKKGSIFMVEIPAANDKPVENNHKKSVLGDLTCKVLLVDDESAVGETLAEMLKEEGCDVTMMTNALDALKSFNQNACDIVLTDLSMPGVNGLELAKRIKALRQEVPIIMITGWQKSEQDIEKHNGYIDGFIEKPFNLKQIREEFKKVLKPNGNNLP